MSKNFRIVSNGEELSYPGPRIICLMFLSWMLGFLTAFLLWVKP